MKTLASYSLKNNIDSMFNTIFVAVNELNEDIKRIMLNIMTSFMGPKLQVAYA